MRKFFKQIFLLLIIIAFIPVVLLNIYLYRTSISMVKKNVRNILFSKLEHESEIVKKTFLKVNSDIFFMKKLFFLSPFDIERLLKSTFYFNEDFTEILLLDEDFNVITGISRYQPSCVLKKPVIKSHLNCWTINKDNDIVLAILKKVSGFKNFNRLCYIYSEISLKRIFHELSSSKKDFYSYFILNDRGNLIYHSNFNFVLTGKDYHNVLNMFLKNKINKFYSNVTLLNPIHNINEKYFIVLKHTIVDVPLFIGVEIPESKAFIQINQLKRKILIEVIIILILMVIISLFFARNITLPLRKLQEASIKITNGDFNVRIENKPKNEIGVLGDNIEKMAETIKDYTTAIEVKNEELNKLFNSIRDGIYIIDNDYNIYMINNSELNYLRLSREDVIGRKCYEVFAKRNKPCEKCFALKGNDFVYEKVNLEKMGFRKKCSREFVNFSFVQFSENKHLIYIHDISNLLKAIKETEEEHERFKITLQSIGDGVIVTDEQSNIVLINKVALKIMEYEENEVLGKNISEVFKIVDERDGKPLVVPVIEALKDKKIVSISNHAILITKYKNKVHIEDSAAPIFSDGETDVLGVVLVFRDVTEKKRIEEEVSKIEKLKSIGRLAAGIAHDFNNILTAIYGNVSLAKILIDNKEKASELLTKVESSIGRAKDLTSQLLTFAKGGSPVKKVVSIISIIKDSVEFILAGSSIDVHYDFEENVGNVNVDPNQISQVFQNLALNAKEAMEDKGEIFITLSAKTFDEREGVLPPGKYIKISFRDTGKGIEKSILDKIFEPFFTTKDHGSGLGLAISFSIIKNHDGSIVAKSEPGKGTEFIIYLPVVDKEIEEHYEVKHNKNIESLNILIMDDNIELLESSAEMFSLMGFFVEKTTEGETAIEKYKEALEKGKKFDLVILDLTIKGGIGGSEVVKEILKIDKDAMCVVSSGYFEDEILANYKNYGFKYSLQKPYTFNDIKKMLSELFGS